jgi:hypothetical protein
MAGHAPHSHVYTVASGFGLRVIPVHAPYGLAIGPESHQLDIECWPGTRDLFARVTPADGGYSSMLGEGTGALDDVVDIVPGPAFTSWWLETSVYRIPLVSGWRALAEGVPDQPSMFDLVRPDGALLFVQTPKNIPAPARMVAPGQRLHAQGTGARSEWVEVRYQHDGVEWAQRHDVVPLAGATCIVTVQCPVSSLASIEGSRDAVVNGIDVPADA